MLNPALFVMWDNRIATGYGVERTAGGYATQFLPRVQLVARRALSELKHRDGLGTQQAIAWLGACGHPLTKVMDEYDFVKYTRGDSRVWRVELSD